MAGIQESIDLDISAALRQVTKLDAALNKAGKVDIKVDGAGLSAATGGIGKVSQEARTAEAAVGGFAGILSKSKGELAGLASTAAGTVSPALGNMQGIISSVGSSLAGPAGVAAAGVAVGVVLGKMALSGVKDVLQLASAVRTVQRATGATAEDASRLVAVGKIVGVSAETEAAAFFKLSRNIQGHGDVLEKDGIIVARNGKGQIDLSQTLLSVADAYQKAGKGAAGNQVLFDAFGRSGLALAPILGLDRKQLEEFYAAAEKHHEILSQADLDKARAYKIATHELGEAFGGLERELGLAVIPALTAFAHVVVDVIDGIDSAAHLLGPVTDQFGGVGKMVGGLAKDAFPEASIALDLLRGHFRGAVVDAIPFGNTLHNLFFHHSEAKKAAQEHAVAEAELASKVDQAARSTGLALPRLKQLADEMGVDLKNATDGEIKKLAEAAQKLNEAVTPTQRLTTVTGTLGNQYATTSERVKAFKTALDATLGSALSVSDAEISLRQSVTSLATEVAKGRDKNEALTTWQDRLASSANGVVRSIESEADALVKAGKLGADSASQTAFLRTRLLEVADAVPAVRGQILGYVATLDAIPASKTTILTADVTNALKALHIYAQGIGELDNLTKQNLAKGVGTGVYAPGVQDAFNNAVGKAGLNVGKAAQNAGEQAAANLAKAIGSAQSLAGAARAGSAAGGAAGKAAAEKAAKEVETTLRRSAAPGQGLDLGGFIVSGIGADLTKTKANNAALALIKGMRDVVKTAEVISPDEAAGILDAVRDADQAAKDLGKTRKELGANSIEAAIAEQKLRQAQSNVNDKVRDAVDATKAVTDALAKQKDAEDKARTSVESYNKAIRGSLDGLTGALRATRALASAQRDLRDAQASVSELTARNNALPGEIAAADQALAAARAKAATVTTQEALTVVRARQTVVTAEANVKKANEDTTATALDRQEAVLALADAQDQLTAAIADSVGPTDEVRDASQKLKDLQDEQKQVAKDLAAAQESIVDAELGVVDAQQRLIDQADALGNSTDKAVALFRALGTAAGLSSGQIDALVKSMQDAAKQAQNPLSGNPLAAVPGGSNPFLNTVTGRTAYTGPGGEAGGSRAELEAYARAHGIDPSKVSTWTQPNGSVVAYIPGVAVDPGNLGALAGAPRPAAATPAIGTPGSPYGYQMYPDDGARYSAQPYIGTVNFNAQTATFDESTASSYLRAMELLYS